jgi:hypothetical protein
MNIIIKTLQGLLLFTIALFIIERAIPPQQAHAQTITEDITTEIETSLTSVEDAYNEIDADWLKIKEEVLDPAAWAAAKALLQSMTSDTVDWVNSGFSGSPSFLTNPSAFFSDAADQLTGQFISDTGVLSNLCSPFSTDLRLSLAFQQAGNLDLSGLGGIGSALSGLGGLGGSGSSGNRYSCTLGSIINNVSNAGASASISGFMNGDFSQGGWPAFIALSEPENNESGAFLEAESDLESSIADQNDEYQQQLSQGGGFLTYQQCDDVPSYDGGDESDSSVCTDETPGSVIAASLNKELGNPTDSLVQAHELDEVIGSLASEVMQQVLSGGLYNASQPSADGSASFISQLRNDTSGSTAATTAAGTAAGSIDKYINNATEIQSQYDTIVSNIESIQSTYQSLVTLCQTNDPAEVANVQSILDTQITPMLATYESDDATASSTVDQLTQIQTAMTDATSTDAVNAASQQYADLLSNDSVPTEQSVQDAKNAATSVNKTIVSLQNQAVTYQSASMCGGQSSSSSN